MVKTISVKGRTLFCVNDVLRVSMSDYEKRKKWIQAHKKHLIRQDNEYWGEAESFGDRLKPEMIKLVDDRIRGEKNAIDAKVSEFVPSDELPQFYSVPLETKTAPNTPDTNEKEAAPTEPPAMTLVHGCTEPPLTLDPRSSYKFELAGPVTIGPPDQMSINYSSLFAPDAVPKQ